jgi:hypothetical protein
MVYMRPQVPQPSDSMDDESAEPDAPQEDAAHSLAQLKAEKLSEFCHHAVATADPLQALLQLSSASMLEFAERLLAEMRTAADQTGSLLSLLAEDPTPLQMTLQLNRQAERFFQILCVQQKLAHDRASSNVDPLLQYRPLKYTGRSEETPS